MDSIVLIGFMGSGKTTLGRALAARLQGSFVDLDERLESQLSCGIAEFIERHGELEFRRRELACLEALLQERLQEQESLVQEPSVPRVVATGGGIVETQASHDLLRRLGRVVWLRVSADRCAQRARQQPTARPVLQGAHWRERFASRQAAYDSLADFVLDNDAADPNASLERLLDWLRSVETDMGHLPSPGDAAKPRTPRK